MAKFNMAGFNFEQVSEQLLYLAAQRMVGFGGLFVLGMGLPGATNKICTVSESQGVISLDSIILVRAGNC